jgi:hypothetical protein
MVDASRERLGADAAVALARSVQRIVASRGATVTTVRVTSTSPDDKSLRKLVVGPTGNLRAPAARAGRTLYVGPTAIVEALRGK